MMKKIEPEADGILKDGQVLSFRMVMMDGKQQAMPAAKPHAAVLDDAQKASAIERIKAYDERISNAWRNPPPVFVAQDLSRTPPEVMKPVAYGSGQQVDLETIQADNQARYNERISNAWRSPSLPTNGRQ